MKNKRTGKLPFFKRIVQTDPLIPIDYPPSVVFNY